MTLTTAASYSLTAILLMLPIGLTNAIEFDPSSPKYSCSSVGSTSSPFTATPLPISTLYGSSTILLEPVRNDHGGDGANKMCILSSWTTDLTTKSTTGEGYYVALGKSYDNEDWVRPPGNRERFVAYNCGTATNSGDNFSAGEYLCEVTLPMTSKVMATGALKELDAPYYLTYYERSLSVRNELSRFLQRTTIGPTASELDALEMAYLELGGGGSSSHAATMERLQTEWVQAQQDPSTFSTGKFSSLREYYRKRLNPRSPEVYRIGEAGPHPCEQHSRWRKFAFTAYDVVNSQYLRWGNNALGGFYQQQIPHKVTVETVKLSPSGVVTEGPTGSPSISGVVPTMSPVIARTVSPVSRLFVVVVCL